MSKRIRTARLWAILVSYTLIFVLQIALKINDYKPRGFWRTVDGPDRDIWHYTMGIWNILSRRTWRRHGQYPTGVCFIVDWPDGGRGSIPRGSAIYLMDRTDAGAVSQGGLLYSRWTGRMQGQYPKGVCCMVMDWTEAGAVSQGVLQNGRLTG